MQTIWTLIRLLESVCCHGGSALIRCNRFKQTAFLRTQAASWCGDVIVVKTFQNGVYIPNFLVLHLGENFMKILTKIAKLPLRENFHVFIHIFMQIFMRFYEG